MMPTITTKHQRLAALRHAGVHVLPSETVFYALLHPLAPPFFTAYTQLVKSHA